jgi:metal-responsive CopG/Arc/MetJ family transcriptional regulator
MAFSVGGLLLGLINEIRINLPLSQELIDRIDAALGPEKYRTGLIRDALRRELERRERQRPRKPAVHSSGR